MTVARRGSRRTAGDAAHRKRFRGSGLHRVGLSKHLPLALLPRRSAQTAPNDELTARPTAEIGDPLCCRVDHLSESPRREL